MGLAHSPRIATDGLALSLDAANAKNYNVGISTNWIDVIGDNNGTLSGGTHHNDGPFPGAGYVEFDGTSDYLDIGSSADFAFGTGDFTIEVWVYLKANSVGVIYSNEVSNSLFLYLSSGNLVVRNYGTSNLFDLAGPSLNTWTHIALSRSGTDLRLFFNGVQQGGTVTNSTNWTQNGAEIGAYGNGTQSLNGYMSNLRVVKGTALYTAAFTPPTKPLTDIPGTKLLTCQGSTITAAGISTHTITVNGNASAKLGFPASAFEFDGTSDYVTIPNNSNFAFGTGNFTTELWVYFLSSGAYQTLFDFRPYNTNGNYPTLIRDTDGDLYYYVNGSRLIDNVSVSNNQWYHVAICREGTTTKLYLDGVSKASASDSTNYISSDVIIGAINGGNNAIEGYISGIKIYKGKGLTATEVLQNYNALKGRYA